MLDSSHQGQRYGSEAENAIFQYWYPQLMELNQKVRGEVLNQIHASCAFEANPRSSALLLENGFRLDPKTLGKRTLYDSLGDGQAYEVKDGNFYFDLNGPRYSVNQALNAHLPPGLSKTVMLYLGERGSDQTESKE